MMQQKKVMQVVGGGIIIAIAAFYSGMRYGTRQGITQFTGGPGGRTAQFGGAAGGGARRGGGLIAGEVMSKDETSIVVKSRDSGSKIIIYGASTQVMKAVAGSADDIVPGAQVTVVGSQNGDGSITAQSIQLRPSTSTPPMPRL